MMGNDAELEGAYRLFSNEDVSPRAIFAAHFGATAGRVRSSAGRVVVAHDTTACSFSGEAKRRGVGTLNNGGQGLAVHAALALAAEGVPLGLLDVETHTRFEKVGAATRAPADRESARWPAAVDAAMARVGPGHDVVHVMDREGDSYLLFDHLCQRGYSFVIRLCQDRRIVDDDYGRLFAALEDIDATLERDVELSRRSDRNRRLSAKATHPARRARTATLAIGARTVTICAVAKQRKHAAQRELTLNVVRVWEPSPVAGEPAVEWMLITNLPIETESQLEQIVDCYRLRWTIEEFFKALKTGCAFEDRQLESRHALENALSILAPIACQLLLLRTLARRRRDAAATEVLTPLQLDVLRAISERFRLSRRPTVGEALFAVAGLGGFLKRNGEPGWHTIGQGYERLLDAERVWRAAKGMGSCDQS